MFEQLNGKRLLVIGSDEGTSNIVLAAKAMGVYTIAADEIPKSVTTPAKNLADESWDIDYSETEKIVQKCREAGVNGVFAGYSEFRVLAACRISKALGTPFYATEEQINLTWNKRLFKDLCIRCGVRVPKDYLPDPTADLDPKVQLHFPVIVKPTDYAGRKGITVCNTREQIEEAIRYARSKSVSRSVLIEDFIQGQEYAALYTIVNGKISLSCIKDKYNDDSCGTLCELALIPSRYTVRYIAEADEKIRNLIKAAKMENGVAQFQGIVNEEGFWLFEMGYRLPGGNDYVSTENCHGINYMKMMISHSLTGDMGDNLVKDSPFFDRFFAQYVVYAHGGTVSHVDYQPLENTEGICDIHIWAKPGRTYSEDGTTQQKAFTCQLTGRSIDEIIDRIHYIQEHLTVEDKDGNNLLFEPFDTARLKTPLG